MRGALPQVGEKGNQEPGGIGGERGAMALYTQRKGGGGIT